MIIDRIMYRNCRPFPDDSLLESILISLLKMMFER